MAGAMRKMGVYLGLVEDDQLDGRTEDYSYGSTARARSYDRDDYAESERETRRDGARTDSARHDGGRDDSAHSAWGRDYDEADETDYREAVPAVHAPVRRVAEPSRQAMWSESSTSSVAVAPKRSSYRITTLHPRTYNEARTIGEHFRDSVPVIMNLSEMDDSDAKRLVDFAAGLSFGLRGSIERVTNKVFLLSPQNVSVTAEDKARIAEGGLFNQS